MVRRPRALRRKTRFLKPLQNESICFKSVDIRSNMPDSAGNGILSDEAVQ